MKTRCGLIRYYWECYTGWRIKDPRMHKRLFRRKFIVFARRVLSLFGAGVCCALLLYFLTLPRTYFVYYGKNSQRIKVEFADAHLSDANKSAIVKDLNSCLKKMSRKVQPFSGHRSNILKGAEAYTRILNFHPYFNPRADVRVTPDGQGLEISQTFSDTYTNAFAFAAAHSEMVAAGYRFVDFISSPNFSKISPDELQDYVVVDHMPDEQIRRQASQIISHLSSRFDYLPPSILSFQYRRMSTDHLRSDFNMQIPYLFADGYIQGIYQAIWRDGKWKLYGLHGFNDRTPEPRHAQGNTVDSGARKCL